MKKSASYILIGAILTLLACAGLMNRIKAYAASSDNVNATVKLSVCGNDIAEDGEDCDNADWLGRTCTNLGYAGGTLACSIACDFDTTGCTVPLIDPAAVTTTQVPSLYAAGLLAKPPLDNVTAVTSLTATTAITTLIPTGLGTDSAIILPDAVTLSKTNNTKFDPTQLSASLVNPASVQGLPANAMIEQVLQWGIAGSTVTFSAPVTVNAYVGNALDGQTLYIYGSTGLTSGWGTDGIVTPTCVVANGYCSFQATKSAYFAIARIIVPTSTPTPVVPSAGPTQAPTAGPAAPGPSATPGPQAAAQTAAPSFWQQLFERPGTFIPQVLRVFYADANGKIGIGNIFTAVSTWVNSWREIVAVEIYGKQDPGGIVAQNKVKCDINDDNQCNLVDFSILLYYVGK